MGQRPQRSRVVQLPQWVGHNIESTLSKDSLQYVFWTVTCLDLEAPATATKPGSGSSTGTGQVFMVNPVQSSGDQTLADQNDSSGAVPDSAYATVTLHNLDGSGYLRGTWVNVVAETGTPAYSPTGSFTYLRDDDRFEQVMAYYFVDAAQRYLQGLGFGSQLPAVNAESQDVRTNQWGIDNSYSWDKHDVMRFGKGGVDDAEDGEAFGDYLAVTVGLHEAKVNSWPVRTDPTCVADWDSVSYTRAPHCLRTLSENKHYPEDLRGEVHADGEIWSQALGRSGSRSAPVSPTASASTRSSGSPPTPRSPRRQLRRWRPHNPCMAPARPRRSARLSQHAGSSEHQPTA